MTLTFVSLSVRNNKGAREQVETKGGDNNIELNKSDIEVEQSVREFCERVSGHSEKVKRK